MKTIRQTPQAINKPMVILGIERSLLAIMICFSVVVASKVSAMLGGVLFLVGCYFAKRITREDPDRLKIAQQEWRLSPIYDPIKRCVK